MIRIISADDHALIRKGIRHIVDRSNGIQMADEVESGSQLLKKLRDNEYDVILMDLSMPGMDVFELVQKVKVLAPQTPILILSMHPEEQFGIQLIRAGVSGYVNKSSGLNELTEAIRQVHSGKRYISNALADKLAERLVQNAPPLPHEALSEREFQVLCHIASGKPVSAIAEELNLSVKTISTYRTRLLEKMNMDHNAQLTYYAIQHRLV